MPTRLPTRPRHPHPAVAPAQMSRDLRAWFTTAAARAARAELASLLETAAELDLDDPEARAGLRARAHRTTSRLTSEGLLPPHLVVEPDDPIVTVLRTLAIATRRVTPAPATAPDARMVPRPERALVTPDPRGPLRRAGLPWW
jgi:hypothetical protein